MRARSLRIVFAATAAFAALVRTSAAYAPAPQWQRVPGLKEFSVPVWVAGRLWFFTTSNPHGYWSTDRSAPIRNGRLGAWTTAPQTIVGEVGWTYLGLLGDQLVFQQGGDIDVTKWRLVGVDLLPNGKVGKPVEISGGAPPPKSSQGATFVRLPDRTVQIVGIHNRRHEMYPDPGACCDINGQPVNYASLTGWVPRYLGLGLDRQGRLWLAWGERKPRPPSIVRIVQLDTATLKPIGAPAAIPRLPGGNVKALICADTCRLLRWGLDARGRPGVVLWGPGDSAATLIRPPVKPACTVCDPILDARDVDGHLIVAYLGAGARSSYTVGLARGDALGRHLRVVGSVSVPFSLAIRTPILLTGFPTGVLSPDGFAAVAYYETRNWPLLRVAVLPLHA
jgi:hypothetical protein